LICEIFQPRIKMFSLQELTFGRLSPEQKLQIPEIIIEDIKIKAALRILKARRKTVQYRLNFIRKRFEHKLPLTKFALLYAIAHEMVKDDTLNVLSVTKFFHDYFHYASAFGNQIVTEKHMDRILGIFKGNSAHDFFAKLHFCCKKPSEISFSISWIYNILRPFERQVLEDMYVYCHDEFKI